MATQSGLTRCRHSETPLTCLSEFVEKLAELGWDQQAIRDVERGVLTDLHARQAESSLGTEMA